ncbi:MAG: winged helix-turn-helix domain-containing protein [Nitrososphaera sp.]
MKLPSDRFPEKRNSFDICADMLRVLSADIECRPAILALKSHLDSRGIARYTDFLVKNELAAVSVGDNGRGIKISEKGRYYLNQYVKLIAMLE